VTIFGSGYVGLVTGACLADAGNHVLSVDIDEAKVKRLRAGEIPIHEPGLEDVIKNARAAGRLDYKNDAAAGVNGQIFSVRKNEIFLMGQSRPLRRVHRAEGWTAEDCALHMVPAFKDAFYPATERTNDVFSSDPS